MVMLNVWHHQGPGIAFHSASASAGFERRSWKVAAKHTASCSWSSHAAKERNKWSCISRSASSWKMGSSWINSSLASKGPSPENGNETVDASSHPTLINCQWYSYTAKISMHVRSDVMNHAKALHHMTSYASHWHVSRCSNITKILLHHIGVGRNLAFKLNHHFLEHEKTPPGISPGCIWLGDALKHRSHRLSTSKSMEEDAGSMLPLFKRTSACWTKRWWLIRKMIFPSNTLR